METNSSKAVRRGRRLKNNIIKEVTQLRGEFFIDLKKKSSNTVLLVGSGRSGTTWISNMINHNNRFRYMFEPFHPHYVKQVSSFGLYKYIRPTTKDDRFFTVLKRIITGRMRNKRVDQYNRRFFCQKRLIKDISSHLFLKWIQEHFPDVCIILLLRHPCAVAASKLRMKQGWNCFETPEDFLKQKELVEDFLQPHVEQIKQANDDFEKQIICWCIIHHVLFSQFQKSQLHLAFYENFCEDPELEIKRLFTFIQKKISHEAMETIPIEKLKRPSQTTHRLSAVHSGGNPIDDWRSGITHRQLQRACQILADFNLDTIYSDGVMPGVSAAYDMLKKN